MRTFTDEPAADEADVDESVLDNDADEGDADEGLDSDEETLGDETDDDNDDQDDGSDDDAPEATTEPTTEAPAKLSVAEREAIAKASWEDAVSTIANGDEADIMTVASAFGQLPKPVDALDRIGGRTAMELLTAGSGEAAMSVTVFKNAVENVLTTVVAKAAAGPSPEKIREALVQYVASTTYVRDALAYALATAPALPDLGDLTDEEKAVVGQSEALDKALDRIGTLISREFSPPKRKNASATGVPRDDTVYKAAYNAARENGVDHFEHKNAKGEVIHTLDFASDGSATVTRVSTGETRVIPNEPYIAKHSAEWVVGKGTNLNGYKHWASGLV